MSIFMPQGMPNQLYPMTIPARHPYSGSPQMMWLDAFMREKVRHDRLEDAQKVEGTDEGTVGRGAAGGAISGAITGTKISPGWGTLIGAVAGGALGAAGSYAGERERQKQQRAGYSGANTYAQDTQGLIDAAGGLVTQMYGPSQGQGVARMANLNAEYLRDQGHQRLQAAAQQPMGVAGSQAGFNQAQAMAAQMAERAGLETQWSTPTKIEIGQLNEALRLIGNDDTLTPEMKEQSTRFVMQQLQSKRPGWVPKKPEPMSFDAFMNKRRGQGPDGTWYYYDEKKGWQFDKGANDAAEAQSERGQLKRKAEEAAWQATIAKGDDVGYDVPGPSDRVAAKKAVRDGLYNSEKAYNRHVFPEWTAVQDALAAEKIRLHEEATLLREREARVLAGQKAAAAQAADPRLDAFLRGDRRNTMPGPPPPAGRRPSGPLPGEPQQQGPPPGSPQAAVQEAQSVLSDIAERAGTDDPTKWSKKLKDVAKPAAEQMVAALEAAFPDPTQIPPELREMLQSLFDAGIIEK
jgi:hypothetical protein